MEPENHDGHEHHDEQAEKRANIQHEMDEMIKKHDSAKAQAEPVAPSAPKSSKTPIIAIAIVLALVVLGLIGYIILDKTIWNKSSSNQSQSQSQIDNPDEIVVSEITDNNVKSELDKESSIMLGLFFPEGEQDFAWKSIVAGGMYNYFIPLMEEEKLSDQAKIFTLLRALQEYDNAFVKVARSDYTNAEIQDIYKDSILSGDANSFYDYVLKIDADTVAKAYKELYGEDINHQSAKEVCGGYYYDAKKGLYLKGLFDGCGGASPISYNLYREKYETAGDKAYIDMRVATVNCAYETNVCDYYSGIFSDITGNEHKIGSTSTYWNNGNAVSIITDDNYEQFAPYRIIFDKQDDGSYAFEKVEKL